jgi:5-methylcytosine-specific restriction protein A
MPYIERHRKKKTTCCSDNTPERKERRKWYNKERWNRLREWKLTLNPLCEICEQHGIHTPAVDVHHIKSPFGESDNEADRYELFFDLDNLQSICKECHGRLHHEEQRR